MKKIFALCLPILFLAACSSTPERAEDAPSDEKHAAKDTDDCLDNPELARVWGECNVKHTLFKASASFAQCRESSPHAGGIVSFELRVKPDGQVKRAKASKGEKNTKLVACLSGVMNKLRFAPTPKGKEATITVPYQLD